MKIKAILFDIDNTLIDFIKMKEMCCEAAIDAMIKKGLKAEKKQALKELYYIYRGIHFEGRDVFQRFLKKVMGRVDYKILAHGINAYRKVRFDVLETYPEVVPTLKKLKKKGLKLGVVSDAPRVKAWTRLAAVGLDGLFDFVLTFEDVKVKKPHKIPFEKALEKLKLEPGQILFVGDNPKKDILGANKIGMKTVLAKYGQWNFSKQESEYETPDFEIEKFSEILELV